MKFRKHHWERDKPVLPITKEMVESKIKIFYPKCNLEKFQIMNSGLANTNILFKLAGINDPFLLRIYNRDSAAINIEILLSQKFGYLIPMPEFLFVQQLPEQSFVIQKWFNGIPLYKIIDNSADSDLTICIKEIAYILSNIASQKFSKAGFFKGNLEIEPHNIGNSNHPFISYIEECLFKNHAGKNLGLELRDKLWDFVIKNRDFFPEQEPACLVHGDFNFDNILIDPTSYKVVGVLDWEFAFSGSYLFDIGTFLRFELPFDIKKEFIKSYEHNTGAVLPENFEKMIKIQDIANFVGLINHPSENSERVKDITCLIHETLVHYQ